MATAVKGDSIRAFVNWPRNGQSDEAIDCRNANAANVQVFVSGTSSPSATISIEGAPERGGNYQTLPDSNATQRLVAGDASYEVNVGTPWARVRIADISGTYANGQGYTIIVTPYVSAGSRQRPQWWDRNPVAINNTYDSAPLAPHASTVRFTYTVPAGKRAMLTNAWCRVIRWTAPSAAADLQAALFVQPVGGSASRMLNAILIDAAVGAKDAAAVGQGTLLSAGDVLTGQTYDLSTGGTVVYNLSALLTEFDA